jgi:C_GCAxxG_C_C family probable redox protein
MTDVDDAVANFQDGLNCCQSILLTYGGLLGLARESAVRLGTGFGGGMARHGEVCGAVTGAIMVLGIKYGMTHKSDTEAKDKTYELVTDLIEKFKTKHNSIICKDILDCDLNTPEGRQKAKDENKFKTICPDFVRTTAEILEEIL